MEGDVIWLALAFCVVAFLYASVGFGGGSSYTAILAIAGLSAAAIPVVSLTCNLIVASGGAYRFISKGHFPARRMAPLFYLSLPMAYLAGRYRIGPTAYFMLLAIALAVAAFLLWRQRTVDQPNELQSLPKPAALGIGAFLGTLSGLTGIGGGIYLSPVLMLKRWAMPKEAAATAALYILLNSIAGLAGQLSKPGSAEHVGLLLPLGAAVLVGGTLGSHFGSGRFSPELLKRGTAVLVGIVAIRLLVGSFSLILQSS
ncbi:MAG: sulfite exporter TauE/SafE family protein [Puniceicoccaceae bacterium]